MFKKFEESSGASSRMLAVDDIHAAGLHILCIPIESSKGKKLKLKSKIKVLTRELFTVKLKDISPKHKSHFSLSSHPWKKSLPNSPLLSLNRIFLLSVRIFSISSALNLKSLSRLVLIREGVFDFGSTEWPRVTPHARQQLISKPYHNSAIRKGKRNILPRATCAALFPYCFPISAKSGSSINFPNPLSP